MADHSWLWLKEDLSDVKLRLVCTQPPAQAAASNSQRADAASDGCPASPSAEGTLAQVTDAPGSTHDNPSSATEVCMEIPAHSVVLASASGYWKERLLRWRTCAVTKAAAATAQAATVVPEKCKVKHTPRRDGTQCKGIPQVAASEASIKHWWLLPWRTYADKKAAAAAAPTAAPAPEPSPAVAAAAPTAAPAAAAAAPAAAVAAAVAAPAPAMMCSKRKVTDTEQGGAAQKKRATHSTVTSSEIAGSSTAAKATPDVMPVQVDDPDCMEAARCILQYAYTHKLTEKASVPLLLQMAVLADKWDMSRAFEACLKQAGQIKPLTVDDINTGLGDGLPAVIKAHCSFQVLIHNCSAALMDMFKYARVVVVTPELLQAFCSLSLNAVQLWAKQDTLTVDSENTVAVLLTHWWCAHVSSLDEAQMDEARSVLTGAIRAGQLTSSFLMGTLELLPWFKSTPEAIATLRILHSTQLDSNSERLSEYDPVVRCLMAAEWVKPARRQEAEQLATMTWWVTKAQLDQLHKEAARGCAKLCSPKSLYWCGYRWFLLLKLDSQRAPLQIGARFTHALPSSLRFDHLPPILTAEFNVFVDKPAGVETALCYYDIDEPLRYGFGLYGSTVLDVPATTEPRANSYPPDSYWWGDKLHLQIKIEQVW